MDWRLLVEIGELRFFSGRGVGGERLVGDLRYFFTDFGFVLEILFMFFSVCFISVICGRKGVFENKT